MFIKHAHLFLTATLITIMLFPTMPVAASAQSIGSINGETWVLSDGQFVYGPNVGGFQLKTYLDANASHLAKYADDLYGRSEYFSINPKVYLTLLEVHSHLISIPNTALAENPFGLNNGNFIAQTDIISKKMTEAYYLHLYTYSTLPVSQRSLESFVTPEGVIIDVAPETNAGTYAIIAGLAAINTQNISLILDNSQANGFAQTYRKLFGNEDPLDETNHIDIPGTVNPSVPGAVSPFAAPSNLLQLPFLNGLSWRFGGVHDTGGCSGLGTNGCQFTDASAMDFSPIGSTWGMNTSNMWVVASAAGTPTRVSNCMFKVLHAGGWETFYYHLEKTQTYPGPIKQNDKIGVIANTKAEATCNGGSALTPHVHLSLRHNGANVAINGTALSGWYVHAGRWSYDTDPNYMWLARSGTKIYAYDDTVLSEAPPVTFNSSATQDGWILESSETSDIGGTMNSTATTFNLGDEKLDKQYRAILSFNTGALDDTAVITKVTLRIKSQTTGFLIGNNNPFTWGLGLNADVCKNRFGTTSALQLGDFNFNNATNCKLLAGTFVNSPPWYSANILATAFAKINLTGLTQFRLRFAKDDNDDGLADYMKFYSGNAPAASQPQLIIEYYVP